MKSGIILFLLLGVNIVALAQNTTDESVWDNIQLSLEKKKNLLATLSRLQSIKEYAMAFKNYNEAARAAYYETLIKDCRSEDTAFFKNSAFIDSILFDPASPVELKMWMHFLQAKRLGQFRSKSLRFNVSLYEVKDLSCNYAALSKIELDSLIYIHLDQSKKLAGNKAVSSLKEIDWIASDTSVFLFKPLFADIITAEQIFRYKGISTISDKLRNRIMQWLSLSQNDFIDSLKKNAKSTSDEGMISKLYYDWISSQKSKDNSYFIETLARKYFYSLLINKDSAQKIYVDYLKQLISSSVSMVKAHGVYQLCLLWNSLGSRYHNRGDYPSHQFDTTYQYYPAKALSLYEENIGTLKKFPALNTILDYMKQKILSKELKLNMQEYQLPHKPILTQIDYQNVHRIYYKIVRAWLDEPVSYPLAEAASAYLSAKDPVINAEMVLSLPDDHNEHTAFLKLDPLPPGRYFILLADNPIRKSDSTLSCLEFTVTGIVTLGTEKRVFLLDATSGKPLEKATVYTHFKPGYSSQTGGLGKVKTEKKYDVSAKGYVIVDPEIDSIKVFTANDSVSYKSNMNGYSGPPSSVYSEDDYDDLVEFYDDNIKISIFTDRSIYRPGQTVYYKAIFTTPDPVTGKMMIVNNKNLKHGRKRMLKEWIKEYESKIYIVNPFSDTLETIAINPNEYGSMSGSFKIPLNNATGEWSFETDLMETDNRNEGEFRVEEYKRPTFDLTIENEKRELKPGDPFKFTVKVKSFSGAKLNNVKVNYTLTRSGDLTDNSSYYRDTTLYDTSGITNIEGILEIPVTDSLLKSYQLADEKDLSFSYYLEANVIDEIGESYDADSRMTVYSQPVFISLPLSGNYNRTKLPSPLVKTSDRNAGEVFKMVKISIYKVADDNRIYANQRLDIADQWLYPSGNLESWFPYSNFRWEKLHEERTLVYENTVYTGAFERLSLPIEKFVSGKYAFEATCLEKDIVTGKRNGEFSVYDLAAKKLPTRTFFFSDLVANALAPRDTIRIINGSSETSLFSIFQVKWYSQTDKKLVVKDSFDLNTQSMGLNEWKFIVPKNAVDRMEITQICLINGEIFKKDHTVFLKSNSTPQPEIIIEKYRKVLVPGEKGSFTISIKTKNEKVAAELMSTLYDASLDKLEEHHWNLLEKEPLARLYSEWDSRRNTNINVIHYTLPYFGETGETFGNGNTIRYLLGRVPGVFIETPGLSDVVVVGYGSVKKMNASSSLVSIRGVSTINIKEYAQPLVILDGVPYTGDLGKLDPLTITQGMVLKGADASSIYGARGSNGVLIISTKGEIKLPIPKKEEPPVRIRKDFNETAFFFPNIYADKDGYYKLSFTIPETLTEWNWKLLAHTKGADFVYGERKIFTQLPLMVQPNMPRLLYQGDKINLQSRIVNLDTSVINGKASCKVEDAVTGQDITGAVLVNGQKDFSVNRRSNSTVGFELKVPRDQLNPLKIILTAKGTEYADAEEHIIPILSKEILVKKNLHFQFVSNDTLVQPLVLKATEKFYGVGLSIDPTPQSGLVNSLSYLANYSFNCAEQLFNKLLAHVTSIDIMRRDRQLNKSWSEAVKERKDNAEIPNVLTGEMTDLTMPWLALSAKTTLEQKRILQLLDTVHSNAMIKEYLVKLYSLQNTDGGLSWFLGGLSNNYISSYVLAGFGKLNSGGWVPASPLQEKYYEFINKLVRFTDQEILNARQPSLFDLYASSFWITKYPMDSNLLLVAKRTINESWKKIDDLSLAKQALLINTSLRIFADVNDSIHQNALKQLNSITQLAIVDEANGIRWKTIADSDDLNNSDEETLDILSESFILAGSGKNINQGILKWVLRNKTDHSWATTKSTSAMVNMLIKDKEEVTEGTQSITGRINDSSMTVSNDIVSGNYFSFNKYGNQDPITLHKQSVNIARGSLSWYYFTSLDQVKDINSDVNITKSFYRYDAKQNTWETALDDAIYKIGDKVRVSLTVETRKMLRYVYIDDKRAASFEPSETRSGNEYENGISYYKSVRDAGFQFFVTSIPAGKSIISYEVVVAQEGIFTSGPAMLQCMYSPAITAYSNYSVIKTASR